MKKYGWKALACLVITSFLLIEFYLMPRNPLAGFGVLLLALVIGLTLLILRDPKSGTDSGLLSCRDLDGASRILRYAAAALSFVSLLTTSSGMKAFVFRPDQGWMAYITSFAVQSVLMVFGLLMCHFYTTLGNSESGLSTTGRRLLLGGLTLFFAATVVMSSTFSYAFMAENAYRESWDSDSETIIQSRLMQEIAALDQENERIGAALLENILNQVQNGLLNAAQQYKEQLKTGAAQAVAALQPEDVVFDRDSLSIQPFIEALLPQYPGHEARLLALESQYNTSFLDKLQMEADRYQRIVETLRGLTAEDPEMAQTELLRCRRELLAVSSNVSALRAGSETIRSSVAMNDLSSLRGSFQMEAANIVNQITQTVEEIDQLLSKLEAVYGKTTAGSEDTAGEAGTLDEDGSADTILTEVSDLQRDILLLKARQLAGADGNGEGALDNAAVSGIISRIMNVIQDLSNANALPADSIKPLADLAEQVEEYGKYASLAQDIRGFRSERLRESYYFTGEGSVSRDVWQTERDVDCHTFFAMLNSLPTLSEDPEHPVENAYVPADVLHSLSVLRRDLLGEITALERAFNYFKYEFGKMACFSAFVAVFLDMGTFFTGCFLYGTQYVQAFLKRIKSSEDKAPRIRMISSGLRKRWRRRLIK